MEKGDWGIRTANIVNSASLTYEVCNQLMESFVLTHLIRRPNYLTLKSYPCTIFPSPFLSFRSFHAVLRVAYSFSPIAYSCMLNKTVRLYADEQKDLALVSGLLMKLFSNLSPERLFDVATILWSRDPKSYKLFWR